MTKLTRRQFAFGTLAAGLTTQLSACGTLFRPERKHRAHSGKIDKTILWCDILGIVLFGGLGIIGLCVDFANHTIYLPRGYTQTKPTRLRDRIVARLGYKQELVAVAMPIGSQVSDYEAVASAHFGRQVRLDQMQHEMIDSPRQFFPRVRRLLGRDVAAPVA